MENNQNPNFFHRKLKQKDSDGPNTINDVYQHNAEPSENNTDSNDGASANLHINNNVIRKKGKRSKFIEEMMKWDSDDTLRPPVSMVPYFESQLQKHDDELNTFKNDTTFVETQENKTKYVPLINNINTTNINSGHDSDSSEPSGDLEKLELMTAADFDNDRYARYTIHEMEMKDYVRTISFKNCIEHCSDDYIKNKIVLVVRCGIGLLPMLCVRVGGAKKVIGLEQSACIEYARRIIKDNNYCHKITLIQSSVKELEKLPHGFSEVDVIMSDFMGECGLSQGSEIEEVIEARNRFLKPNGLMIPMCVSIYCQLLEHRLAYSNQRISKINRKKKYKNPSSYKLKDRSNQCLIENSDDSNSSSDDSTNCSWWKNVYGFDMRSKAHFIVDSNSEDEDSNTREWRVMSEPIIQFFDPFKVMSTPGLIKSFNMYECTIDEVRYVQCKDLKLKCSTPFTSANGGDYAHMLELFMVVEFPDGENIYDSANTKIGFSTSCFSPQTRYRQSGLLLQDQLIVDQDDIFIINDFRMWRGPQNRPYKPDNKSINTSLKSRNDENLKLRLRYTLVNKHIKVIDKCCAYTLIKDLY